ncbi:anhydro-N-acetylmuramic acid kinase [Paenibacillus nasutitermitis]|uniref:Anhydro-N-acetylmuramic acid kinase n=1 Tax=Paenibacillus nasutitermitis TaxID=1652958 RepID=A0A916Z1T7_9BACL|nr:anhydro-N-acetylmuramic acid kinase [Paenibacillus nasutitermitis]GGD72175.1 anhydro-N-acetylmuramic acid kinase [Paenibacillus nasutitermitis]
MLEQIAAKSVRTIIGLMSGTSLDGVDAAVVRISGNGCDNTIEPCGFITIPYEAAFREQLKGLCGPGGADAAGICSMNFRLGRMFAEAAAAVAAQSGILLQEVDIISSHGQTIWHQPSLKGCDIPYAEASTLQIGDLSVIAQLTGVVTIGDYRPSDMAAGGQGAPLTPYADHQLFGHPDRGRIVQNIGGIGNCTVLPRSAALEQVTAFDTGPGNMIIDQAVVTLSGGTKEYDHNGEWADTGCVDHDMLGRLLSHPYFKQAPVKTTGREMFGAAYTRSWIAEGEQQGLSPADLVATFTAFTACSIVRSYEDFIFPVHDIKDIIISGGGSKNPVLMRRLAELLPWQTVTASDALGISGDAKEAIAFAMLADNFVRRKPSNLPAVTGADRPVVMGKLALP